MAGTYHSKYHGFASGPSKPSQSNNKSSDLTPNKPSGFAPKMSLEDSLKSALRQRNKPTICSSCHGKLEYKGRGRYICESCNEELITNYGKVRDFLDLTGGATIVQVCEATGLSRREIKELIDDGSVQMVGGRYTITHADW